MSRLPSPISYGGALEATDQMIAQKSGKHFYPPPPTPTHTLRKMLRIVFLLAYYLGVIHILCHHKRGGALLVTFGDRGGEMTSSSGDVTTNTNKNTKTDL